MNWRIHAFCISAVAAGLMMIALPLISEVTDGGRGLVGARVGSRTVSFRPAETEALGPERDPAAVGIGEPVWETEVGPVRENAPDPAEELSGSESRSETLELPETFLVWHEAEGRMEEMALEDYLIGVVAAEMPYTFHSEALKAQAVAARSYCLYKMGRGLTHESGADVCTDSKHCAAYVSEAELTARYGKTTASRILKKVGEAVTATAGEIITYEGQPALALFHARSWQTTESSENVWGGRVPYLVSVTTPEEDSVTTVKVSDAELRKLFFGSDAVPVSAGGALRLTSELNGNGRQGVLVYGGVALTAKKLRSLLSLRSCRFEYQRTENGWLFTVHGYGHGVGMSQYGANVMALSGAGYREILTHYYPGVSVGSSR